MRTVAAFSGDELRDLYRDLILDHARHPRHYGKLPAATHEAEGINPLCGDRLHLYLAVDDDGVVSAASFEGAGCAISVASASLLTEAVTGMHREAALARHNQVCASMRGEEATGRDLGKLTALLGVREFPSRVKCATLAWHALKGALDQRTEPVNTES